MTMYRVSPSSATRGDSQVSPCDPVQIFWRWSKMPRWPPSKDRWEVPTVLAWLMCSWTGPSRRHNWPDPKTEVVQTMRQAVQQRCSPHRSTVCVPRRMPPSASYQTHFDRMAIPASPLWGWNLRCNKKVSYNCNFYSQQARCFAYREMIALFLDPQNTIWALQSSASSPSETV